MSTYYFTPGPWTANGNQVEAQTRLHTIICTTTSKASGAQYAANGAYEAKANARLIAAAPELLAALEDLVALDGKWSNDSYANAEAVIAKAREIAS